MPNEKGCLFLCATPIGNLQDITLRVLETLKAVDLIACEDTRQTLKLLNHFGIEKSVTSYFEHNKYFKGEKIINKLLAGKNVALVSDAGMPGIADPGSDLLKECIAKGIVVTALPGPIAAATGLVLSGLNTQRFCFEGFVPRGKKEKKDFFTNLVREERTLVFYETPHRLLDTLKTIVSILGNRQMAACRELTKKFEEVVRGSTEEVLEHFTKKTVKGEFTLIVEGAIPIKEEKGLDWAKNRVKELVEEGLTTKDAVKKAAQEADITKRDLYEEIMIK